MGKKERINFLILENFFFKYFEFDQQFLPIFLWEIQTWKIRGDTTEAYLDKLKLHCS